MIENLEERGEKAIVIGKDVVRREESPKCV